LFGPAGGWRAGRRLEYQCRVNSLHPGIIETDMLTEFFELAGYFELTSYLG